MRSPFSSSQIPLWSAFAFMALLFSPSLVLANSPLKLSQPEVLIESPTSVTIKWTTDVAADSLVYYGCGDGFGKDTGVRDPAGATSHSVAISGLLPCQAYYFGVRSRAIVAGKTVVPSPSFSPTAIFSLPKAPPTGIFDYYFHPEGPHHVVQGYDLFIQLNAGPISGNAGFKNNSYKITVQNLPPKTALHWPDQEYNGPAPGAGVRGTTYTANDTISFWAPLTTQFELVTNQGGTTPPGSYTINVTASTLLTDGSPGPKKTVPWTVVVDPVPVFAFGKPSSYPPIPKLRDWQSNMATYGAGNWCNLLTRSGKPCPPGFEQCSWYYDGERVFYQIEDYTKHKKWETCAMNAQANYRDQYVMARPTPGAIGGWRVFPDGIYMNYLRTGDPTSKAAVHALATKAAGAALWTGHVPTYSIREATYMLTANRLDTKLGNDRSRQMKQMVSIVLGHIDQITSGPAPSNETFMDGLAAEALIHYYEDGHQDDARIPAAIQKLADWLWDNAWYQNKGAGFFCYSAYQASIGMPQGEGLRNLNLLIAPMYAWLFRTTGKSKYQAEGDQIFASGVDFAPEGTLGWSGKNFMQQYRWSFDFVEWRSNH